ncbi:MAG TPA: signal peptide peptidase SppA [Bauldia sp.]|nr:signal peptide peptidase SppA [Bauldia sp.]
MSLETDSLIDRRRLKRRVSVWRTIAILAVLIAAIVILNRSKEAPWQKSYVARLDVSGIISEDRERDATIERIAKDGAARALIVHINSPGGTVVGGENLFRELRQVAETKPVVAVMGTLATSGGYMTALGADYILARGGSITGSIGVILQTTDVTGLLEKLGISAEAIKSAPLKAVPSPLEPLTEEGREATRALVMDTFNQFIDMVAERRQLPRDTVVKLADGRVYSGREAADNKLIDALGGENEARDWLAENRDIPRNTPVRDIEVERKRYGLLGMASSLAGKALFSERLTLDGLVSLWHPDLR